VRLPQKFIGEVENNVTTAAVGRLEAALWAALPAFAFGGRRQAGELS